MDWHNLLEFGMSSVRADAPFSACICYVTAGSREEARAIGRTLVAERLAACANLLDGMTSLYWWQGTLEQAEETVVILKTRSALVPALTSASSSCTAMSAPAWWRCRSAPA